MGNMEKLRVFTSFSGYDSQCLALDRLGIAYDLVGWSEIDRYAIQAHNALYPQYSDRNYGDISKIDWESVPDFDLFTMSSPCQDYSTAGKQEGDNWTCEKCNIGFSPIDINFSDNCPICNSELKKTRSSLLYECYKAIDVKRPKYILLENVKNLVSKKFVGGFHKWQNLLARLGYSNFTQVLNAKDYGVPQNRERVFMVSILGDEWYNFPKPFPLVKRLKDVLEDNVDEKYYLSPKGCEYIYARLGKYTALNGDTSCTLTAKGINNWTGTFIHPTTLQIPQTTKRTDVVMQLNSSLESGGKQPYQQNRIYHSEGIKDTLGTCNCGNVYHNLRVRKLTPRECFRLMGMAEEDINKIQELSMFDILYPNISRTKDDALLTKKELKAKKEPAISNSQQYKMAGNSIVVDVLYYIFKQLFHEDREIELTLFD